MLNQFKRNVIQDYLSIFFFFIYLGGLKVLANLEGGLYGTLEKGS